MASSFFSLEGQTALVTGGTRGIGAAVAVGLAEAGADVLLVQRDESSQSTKQAIEKLGRKATIYTADLSSQESVAALVPKVLKDGHEIRILVNCAGIQKRHPCEKFPDEDFNAVSVLPVPKYVMQVNLNSVFTITRDVGAHMLTLAPHPTTGRKGSVINYASLLTFQGGFTVPAYAASKGAVGQLTKSFANEWTAKGITVNAIAPGYIETEMNTALLNDKERLASISARIPAGRWGTPEDFKGTSVYLASRASGYVSGHVLVVDGGWMGR
ncbi:hypothetical protein COL5a_011465 [Colletotrichum fioriniae]|nr:hypothetical protein COL5a_011465 [Colletotrichum fioriniae]